MSAPPRRIRRSARCSFSTKSWSASTWGRLIKWRASAGSGARRAQPRGSEPSEGYDLDHRGDPVWGGALDPGLSRAAGQGSRLRPAANRRAAWQGPEGCADDVAGTREGSAEVPLGGGETPA